MVKPYREPSMWMQQYDIFKKSYFNVSYRRCMPHTLALRRAGLDHGRPLIIKLMMIIMHAKV